MLYLKEKEKTWDRRGKDWTVTNPGESSGTATLRPFQTILSAWSLISSLPTPYTRKKKWCDSCFLQQLPTSSSVCHMDSIRWILSFSAHYQYKNYSILATDFSQWNSLYSAVFSSKIKRQRNVIIYSKDFQSSPFQMEHTIEIILNKHLLQEAHSSGCWDHRHGLANYWKRQTSPEMLLVVCWALRQRCVRYGWVLLHPALSGSAEKFLAGERLD